MHYSTQQKRFRFSAKKALIAAGVMAAVALIASIFVWQSGGGGKRTALPPATTSTTTLPIGLAGVSRTWTATENALPGTLGWSIQHPSNHGEMEGYLNTVSAQRGDTVHLFVTTTAPTWSAAAYRMGWYQGTLARQVWHSDTVPGLAQPPSHRDPVTNMVTADWVPSLDVPLTGAWLPGDYLFKLTSSTGWDWYVPLTVRDDESHSPILIVNSVTTWQAYNLWGGADLYSGTGGRSTQVTFDRPYKLGNGSGDFLGNEAHLVQLVEREGFDVSYTTDVDIDKNPSLLLNHRLVLSLGHDEYYSLAMRDGMVAARDHGTNLAFLGANAVFRHIRFQPTTQGPDRIEINYRSAGDPLVGVDNADVTVQWRDPPNNRPESDLLGEMYQCNPVLDDFVVSDPNVWVFAGTHLTAGQHIKGVVGSEYDHYSPHDPQPSGSGVQVMARSPVTCRGRRSTSDFTYYVAPSGAGVIDVGTNLWVPKLLDVDPVTAITLNILDEGQRGPLGRIHPAVPTPPSSDTGVPPPTAED